VLIEKFLSYTLDVMVDELDDEKDIYLLALEITKGLKNFIGINLHMIH
jgi:hypothetical protein